MYKTETKEKSALRRSDGERVSLESFVRQLLRVKVSAAPQPAASEFFPQIAVAEHSHDRLTNRRHIIRIYQQRGITRETQQRLTRQALTDALDAARFSFSGKRS